MKRKKNVKEIMKILGEEFPGIRILLEMIVLVLECIVVITGIFFTGKVIVKTGKNVGDILKILGIGILIAVAVYMVIKFVFFVKKVVKTQISRIRAIKRYACIPWTEEELKKRNISRASEYIKCIIKECEYCDMGEIGRIAVTREDAVAITKQVLNLFKEDMKEDLAIGDLYVKYSYLSSLDWVIDQIEKIHRILKDKDGRLIKNENIVFRYGNEVRKPEFIIIGDKKNVYLLWIEENVTTRKCQVKKEEYNKLNVKDFGMTQESVEIVVKSMEMQ